MGATLPLVEACAVTISRMHAFASKSVAPSPDSIAQVKEDMTDIRFDSIEAALDGPTSELFWVEYADGKATCGHADSFYAEKIPDKYLMFDVGNNKVLANLELNGAVKHFASYRNCYPADPMAPGIWWYKDFTQSGPFAFALEIAGQRYDLAEVDWALRMSLLDNVLPLVRFTGPGVEIKLIAFAPISADGSERPRGLVYGLQLTNTSSKALTGKVIPPVSVTGQYKAHESYVAAVDGVQLDADGALAFELAADETLWVPVLIAAVPGRPVLDQINRLSCLQWLNETLSYFRGMFGQLEMPGDPFPAAFLTRAMLVCFEGLAMNEAGEAVGANWSSFPATMQIWQKDLYHALAPLATHEPKLLTQYILWFLNRSIRHEGDKVYEGRPLTGGVSFSLTNTLTPVVLSGLYYSATGDKTFFEQHPEVLAKCKELLDGVFATREGEPYLYPSEWLSDGLSRGDYHTGSNVVAWYAFDSTAEIIEDVLDDAELADRYRTIAAKTKADIDKWCITDGPMGPQYTEGAFADGTHEIDHDGEETDTTLMPFYGYCAYDNTAHQNHARVAMTARNRWYRASTRGIKDSTWISDPTPTIDATYPGYMTGLAGVANAEEMSGRDGAMTIIRQRTDVDGSIWWWPFREDKINRAYEIHGGIVGKSGWASGVYACHFVSQILGLSYNGRNKVLHFRPFSPTSDFTWKHCRLGSGRFSVEYSRGDGCVTGSVENHCGYEVTVELELILSPGAKAKSIIVDGKAFDGPVEAGTFFDSTTAKLSVPLPAGAGLKVAAEY